MTRLIGAIMDMLFVLGLVWTVGRSVAGFMRRSRTGSGQQPDSGSAKKKETAGGPMARDPVCGMFVSTEVSLRLVRGSETLHFCSKDCLESYQKQSAKS